jgi:hypothetical protein
LILFVAAYVIVDLEIVDPVGFEEYKKRVGAIVEKYGGKYIVSAAVWSKRSKVIGNRNGSLSSSSNHCNEPKNGSIAKNTLSRAKCATVPPKQT